MAYAVLDYKELSEFNQSMIKSLKEHPREAKFFINKMGIEFRKVLRKQYRRDTKRKTGNLLKGIKKGKGFFYKPYSAYSVRVFNVAPHAHLIELGHRMLTKDKKTTKKGKVSGRFVMDKAESQFKDVFEQNCEKYIDKLLEKGFGG